MHLRFPFLVAQMVVRYYFTLNKKHIRALMKFAEME